MRARIFSYGIFGKTARRNEGVTRIRRAAATRAHALYNRRTPLSFAACLTRRDASSSGEPGVADTLRRCHQGVMLRALARRSARGTSCYANTRKPPASPAHCPRVKNNPASRTSLPRRTSRTASL